MSGLTLLEVGLRSWYADDEIAVAQAMLASEAAAALAGHEALWAWDLGNDEHVLPFLALITSWLGRRRDVLFSEFCLPSAHSTRSRLGDRVNLVGRAGLEPG